MHYYYYIDEELKLTEDTSVVQGPNTKIISV
jgi:hypothetical protein